MASKFFDQEKKEVASRLGRMVNAVMLAYWGQPTPQRFARAWDNACRVLDRINGQENVTYARLSDALEWLVEASKEDTKVAAILAA